MDNAACHLSAEAAEVEIGAQYILDGETEVLHIAVAVDRHRFQKFQQRSASKPRCPVTFLYHIVPFFCRDGEAGDIFYAKLGGELQVFVPDFVEDILAEVHQVHLVDGKGDMFDAEQTDQESMAACLGDDASAGIDKDDSQVGRRAACNHIACILLVSRCVGDDELAQVCAEVAICHIDGDALLAFGLQTVQQQSIVYLSRTGIAYTLGVALQSLKLVFVEFLAVEKQSADEC